MVSGDQHMPIVSIHLDDSIIQGVWIQSILGLKYMSVWWYIHHQQRKKYHRGYMGDLITTGN